MTKIIVPATSANLGPGFDSVGLAVDLYLKLEVISPSENWEISHDLGEHIPSNEENLLIQTALSVKSDLQPQKIKMTSNIPLARGLGSSSSVIVAGIELANFLGNLNLSNDEKLQIATKIEGHPDNVAPAIFGNLVVANTTENRTTAVKSDFPACELLAFVPNYELKTSDSRQVLPSNLDYKTAVAASSIANVVVASLLIGDLQTAGKMMEEDLFHEKYRSDLVKEFVTLRHIGHENEAFVTYLSGAGPTVMMMLPEGKFDQVKTRILQENLDGEILKLSVDKIGSRLEN